jgi:error-prone DNA polymerase
LAYASAYLRHYFRSAFTAALLNNQPMGFYEPDVIVRDAQRHGLKVLPIDINRPDWLCTIENTAESKRVVRLGLRHVRGLSKRSGDAIVRERKRQAHSFVQDLVRRIPKLHSDEAQTLAKVVAQIQTHPPTAKSQHSEQRSW